MWRWVVECPTGHELRCIHQFLCDGQHHDHEIEHVPPIREVQLQPECEELQHLNTQRNEQLFKEKKTNGAAKPKSCYHLESEAYGEYSEASCVKS